MKKVIFISALAFAAAVSCNKSEIVDTKFNEQIGFQTYTGRDAMTKAGAATVDTLKLAKYDGIGLYGFYTGAKPWKIGEHAQTAGAIAEPSANLWNDAKLYWNTTVTPNAWTYEGTPKYWTNASDFYSFLAYAPKATTNNGVSVDGDTADNVNITYECPVTEQVTNEVTTNILSTNVDLLYAQVINTTKENGTVELNFKHALSRVTVKAYAPENDMKMQFDVKNVTLSGEFNTTGTLNLATAIAGTDTTPDVGWDSETTKSTDASYVFYDDPTAAKKADNTFDALPADVNNPVDYATRAVTESGETKNVTDNYLMMIPTDFEGTLSVTYTTIYEGQESNPMTKALPIDINFRMGKAYAITLAFTPVLDVITFDVRVDTWGDEVPVNSANTTNGNNPEKY